MPFIRMLFSFKITPIKNNIYIIIVDYSPLKLLLATLVQIQIYCIIRLVQLRNVFRDQKVPIKKLNFALLLLIELHQFLQIKVLIINIKSEGNMEYQ
jgi:hypothetical protein